MTEADPLGGDPWGNGGNDSNWETTTMRIISRREWGARHPDGFGPAPLPAHAVYLHHSAGLAPDLLPPYTDDDQTIRDLEAVGQQRFGRGISYTFLITPVGRVYEGHSVGRMGAHTAGRNSIARAICWVGNYDIQRPTPALLDTTAALLVHGHQQKWWTQPALAGGHRDVVTTKCPGQHAYDTVRDINRRAGDIAGGDMFTAADRAKLDKLDALARRDDVGYARSQILTALGVDDPADAPAARSPEANAEIAVARRVDVGFARDQILEELTAVRGLLDRLLASKP